jgi:hypothetical protein
MIGSWFFCARHITPRAVDDERLPQSGQGEQFSHALGVGQNIVGDGVVVAVMSGQFLPAQEVSDDDFAAWPSHATQFSQCGQGVGKMRKSGKADNVIEAGMAQSHGLGVTLKEKIQRGECFFPGLTDHIARKIEGYDGTLIPGQFPKVWVEYTWPGAHIEDAGTGADFEFLNKFAKPASGVGGVAFLFPPIGPAVEECPLIMHRTAS